MRLRWATAGDQRDRRCDLAHHGELLLADLRRHEAEDPHAPRSIAEERLRLGQEVTDLGAAHQGEREERQATGGRDRLGEPCAIRDAGHRALRDRVPEAVLGRERRARRQRLQRGCEPEVPGDRRTDAANELRHGAVSLREAARDATVLTDGQEARREVVAAEPRRIEHGVLRDREIGARVDAVARDHRGLASIHRGDRGLDLRGER
jgi:hypothetical protein